MKGNAIELDDIQSILVGSHSSLPAARYLFLAIDDAANARRWVGELAGRVRRAGEGPTTDQPCVNVAFTHRGLERLELPRQALDGFSRELIEGMWDNGWRRRVLGDEGSSDPSQWSWGGPANPAIDVLLLLYAKDDTSRLALHAEEVSRFEAGGVRLLHFLDSSDLGLREHFGFRDGVSQPKLSGVTRSADRSDVVADGEFILGYPNGYGQYTTRPLVDPIQDPEVVLPDDVAGTDQRDFGRNGSYLVFRQIAQDPGAFWEFLDRCTESQAGPDPVKREWLAAKMVGRWRSGAPLVSASSADDPALAAENRFAYHREDPHGLKCPVGSHVRRANPRDSLGPKPGSKQSVEVNKRHRLLRRGRSYGPPLAPSLDPEDLLAAARNTGNGGVTREERGILFLCLNANISRQFEFVQNMWVNGPNFGGLRSEPDPLVGARRDGEGVFTIPGELGNESVVQLPEFVHVRGGAYFFMPGIRALRYLARKPMPLDSVASAPQPQASYRPASWSLRLMQLTNAVVQWAMSVTRRQPFATLRNAFDAVFRGPIVKLTQWLINRRRRDDGLVIGEERLLPREDELARRITGSMTHFLFKHYRNRTAERAGNTKTYGLLRARFEVEPALDERYQVGVFQPGASYRAWVRFGGPGPLATADIRNNGILSIGVKLMGVEGAKLLDDERHTQDFTGISAPTFTTPNALENLKLQRHLYQDTGVFYFLNPFDSHYLDAVMQGLYAKSHGSPLDLRYWSCVPYAFGEGRAFQYSFMPGGHPRSRVPWRPSYDYLREAMTKVLANTEVVFDFRIQLQTDAHRMPLENASVIWPEQLSPWVRVARLMIPAQSFDSPAQLAFARRISINPWHSIAEHRPLGNQNRVRKAIYLETSRVRQRINAEPIVEPTGDEVFV